MGVPSCAEPTGCRFPRLRPRLRPHALRSLPALLAAALALAPAGAAAQQPAAAGPPDAPPAPNACLAGTGSSGWCGDGSSATRAKLAHPSDVAVTADGATIVADTGNQVIRRIDASGRIATIAGSGTRGPAVSDVPAASAEFDDPSAVAVDVDGSILVADTGNNAIRRIGLDGRVTTIVADGLFNPSDVIVLAAGQYAIADTGHDRVVSTSPRGLVPLAGTGQAGYVGDGGPATRARLARPIELSLSPAGLLIADTGNRVVRRVAPDRIISTVAGIPSGAAPGATPATSLGLTEPAGVVATPDGGFAVADVGRVWAVAPDGSVQPLLGTGEPGFNGGGALLSAAFGIPAEHLLDVGAAAPAPGTQVDHPAQLTTDAAGDVLVADTNNDRIRQVSPDGQVFTLAGSGNPNAGTPPFDTAPFGGQRPGCADDVPQWNQLGFLPFAGKVIKSGRHPVKLVLYTGVTGPLTVYAWRKGHRYGRRTKRVSAGTQTIPLKGGLRRGRYSAVVDGRENGLHRCSSRTLRIGR